MHVHPWSNTFIFIWPRRLFVNSGYTIWQDTSIPRCHMLFVYTMQIKRHILPLYRPKLMKNIQLVSGASNAYMSHILQNMLNLEYNTMIHHVFKSRLKTINGQIADKFNIQVYGIYMFRYQISHFLVFYIFILYHIFRSNLFYFFIINIITLALDMNDVVFFPYCTIIWGNAPMCP